VRFWPVMSHLCGACAPDLGRPGYNLGTLLECIAGLCREACLFGGIVLFGISFWFHELLDHEDKIVTRLGFRAHGVREGR
jgi:hypothetical protein